MNIQNINCYTYAQTFRNQSFLRNLLERPTNAQQNRTFRRTPQKDSFEKSTTFPEKEKQLFNAFLKKKGKVSKKEYNEIIKKHPSIITQAYKLIEENKPTKTTPAQLAHAAVELKKRYDEQYKGKYTIVSMGTSPAPIAEIMSALGSKVVFLPASGVNQLKNDPLYIFRSKYPTIASRYPNVRYIIDYAKKNGINYSNKDFILLLDYCYRGRSLEKMCDIFIEEEIVKPDLLHDCSILDDLSKLTNSEVANSPFSMEDYTNIANDMENALFQNISNVPHFYLPEETGNHELGYVYSTGKTKRQLFKEFDEYSNPFARAFALCSIHEAMKLI